MEEKCNFGASEGRGEHKEEVGTRQTGERKVCVDILFYEITNRCSYMQSILFHC